MRLTERMRWRQRKKEDCSTYEDVVAKASGDLAGERVLQLGGILLGLASHLYGDVETGVPAGVDTAVPLREPSPDLQL